MVKYTYYILYNSNIIKYKVAKKKLEKHYVLSQVDFLDFIKTSRKIQTRWIEVVSKVLKIMDQNVFFVKAYSKGRWSDVINMPQ